MLGRILDYSADFLIARYNRRGRLSREVKRLLAAIEKTHSAWLTYSHYVDKLSKPEGQIDRAERKKRRKLRRAHERENAILERRINRLYGVLKLYHPKLFELAKAYYYEEMLIATLQAPEGALHELLEVYRPEDEQPHPSYEELLREFREFVQTNFEIHEMY